MRRILKHLSGIPAPVRPCVLGSILRTTGSSPQVPGASALFSPSGIIAGTLGGGVLEFEAENRSKVIAGTGEAILFSYELNADISEDKGAICGGKVLLLLDGGCNKDSAIFSETEGSLINSVPGLLVSVISKRGGDKAVVSRAWYTISTLEKKETIFPAGLTAEDLWSSFRNRIPQLNDKGDILTFIEPLYPLPELVIVGAGHIGQALAHLGSLLDFNVTVIDNRPEFSNRQRFPEAGKVITGGIEESVSSLAIGRDTYIVIMTTGHADDTRALRQCISSDAAYIGMIGSKRKIALVRQRFIDEGWSTDEEFSRVHAPIGLAAIPTKTIQEIAISIAAELIVARKELHDNKETGEVWSVILAAGESTRMKEQKLLMPFGESTMIEKVVEENLSSKTDRVMVVLGSDNNSIMEKLSGHTLKTVYNEDYTKGMFSSVKKGIGSLPENCSAAIISLGDQPMISREVIDKMVGSFASGSTGIIIPVFEGRRGHPLLIPARYFMEILNLAADDSLRTILSAHPGDILEIDVDTGDILRDIDTREQYDNEINK